MNIGERIKTRRKELGLSVDDIADKLNKNRATIYRYESNDIENLPITILEPLAIALNTTPIYLLGLDDDNDNKQTFLTDGETSILNAYNKLNRLGKSEANKRVNELTYIEKYIIPENTLFAAHTKEDIDVNSDTYEEDNLHDINTMLNDDEWK